MSDMEAIERNVMQCQAMIEGRAPRGSGGISGDLIRRAERHQCTRKAVFAPDAYGKAYCRQHGERDGIYTRRIPQVQL
jgi:hypothetical protein